MLAIDGSFLDFKQLDLLALRHDLERRASRLEAQASAQAEAARAPPPPAA